MVSFLPPYTQLEAIPSEYTDCRSCEADVSERRLCGDERGRRRGREPVEPQRYMAEKLRREVAGESGGDGGGAGARIAGYKVQKTRLRASMQRYLHESYGRRRTPGTKYALNIQSCPVF